MPHSPYLSDKTIEPHDRLIVALDFANHAQAQDLVKTLGDQVRFYKLGLELFMAGNYETMLDWLLDQGKQVFVDLKFFDVPQTVGSAVRQLRDKGATFATVHGNDAMLEAAAAMKGDLKILAVTALTSLDRQDLQSLGFDCDVRSLVLSRAQNAIKRGCDGVISSGLEAQPLRENLGPNFLVVTPGIRPVDNKPQDDQKRTVDVEEAFLAGADYIVVGRPIRLAPDPYGAAGKIQTRIERLFPK
jgi:orotidine-5'-phosphate decarboxylase